METKINKPGQAGGIACYRKYGREYMSMLGRKDYTAMREKYNLVPCGLDDFAFVDKETGKIISLLSGHSLQESKENEVF